MNRSGIYVLESPTGQYLGSAVYLARRKAGHFSKLRRGCHPNAILQNAWNKYGGGLIFRPLLICAKDQLLFFEQRAIDVLKPRYNICPRAGSHLGLKRSPESCARMATAQTGKKQSAETKAKRAAALIGRPVSEQTRRKLAAQKGWKHSDIAKAKMRRQFTAEHRAALSRAARGNRNRTGHSHTAETRARISSTLRRSTASTTR